MTLSKKTHDRRALPAVIVLAGLVLTPAAVRANQFALAGGKVVGVWKTTLTLGAGFRAGTPQTQLVGAGAGQSGEFPGATGAVGVNDDAQLNFPKYGDLFAAPLTLTSELNLHHRSGQGVFVRARAWYDMRLEAYDAPHGNAGNAYTPNVRLVDQGNIGAARFKGFDIYDVYYYGNFKAGQTRFLVRVGRQALDWGEGIFYPGINNVNPVDYAWLTTVGARIANGGKLPVNRVYANVVGPAGFLIDGFFNLEFRESVMPACGTYFSGLDDGFQPSCNIATAAGMIDRQAALLLKTKNYYNGKLYPAGVYPDGGPDAPLSSREPSRWSGWGVSARKFVEPLATEIGVYYADYTNPLPNNAPVVGTSALDFAVNTNYTRIKSFAVSVSTGLRNVSLSAQLTRHWDYPAQRNAPAFIEGSTSGKGPYYWMQSYPNQQVPGYYKMNMLQLQYGGVWQFGRLVGLSDATLAGEALMSWNTNNPPTDGPNAERLLRVGNFGLANWSEQGYTCNPGPLTSGAINYCQIDGFQTPFAMGYKLRAATVLPQKGPVSLVPYLFFGQDLTGYSTDFSIVSGRISYGLGFRADVRQTYFIEATALWYRRGTTFDALRDRGQYTVTLGYNLR
jgi:hypothetical protein